MTNIVTASGFETDDSGWTWTLGGARTQLDPYAGAWEAGIAYVPPVPPLEERIGSVRQTLTTWAGNAYVLHGYVKLHVGDEDSSDLFVQIAGATAKTLHAADYADGEWTRFRHEFTVDSSSTLLKFIVDTTESTTWLVDDVEVHRMPIEGEERVIDLVVSTIQDNISAALTAIDGEYNDGITLDVPDTNTYYKGPKGEIGGPAAIVEVFAHDYELFRPVTDPSAGREAYDMPFTVRWTIMSRTADTQETRYKRRSRSTAALRRVFLDNYTLGGTDNAIKYARLTSIQKFGDIPFNEPENPRKYGFVANGVAKVEEIND